MMKSYSMKKSEIEKSWIEIDANGLVLGRLAAEVTKILRGKHKPAFTPHMDCGDYVVITNAEKVHLTGRKRTTKTYYRHTGYPGGIKSITADKVLEGRFPERVIMKAVQRMLPQGVLGRQQLKNLKVYAGESHPHTAQQPVKLNLAARNRKNSKS